MIQYRACRVASQCVGSCVFHAYDLIVSPSRLATVLSVTIDLP